MVNRLENLMSWNDSIYSCIMFPCIDGTFKIINKNFGIVWNRLPDDPDNGLRSKMASECIFTGERTYVKFGKLPIKVIACSNAETYSEPLRRVRFLVYSASYLPSE